MITISKFIQSYARHLSIGSLVLPLACVLLLLDAGTRSGSVLWQLEEATGLPPFNVLLYLSLMALVISVAGLFGVRNGRTAAVSTAAIVLSIVLSAFCSIMVLFGMIFL
ncbi:hypothetical protein DNH61_18920 [Paenibacillus sambharensis]|uniref:Uncharacterized protein n=1 Tax=Paenibacillus sambharensis TaxID=1803190 RepID=A0A2W1LHN0_9BACL|nr:hypothetical protein DNH61_18920 [Paenibacillus sambharensis]